MASLQIKSLHLRGEFSPLSREFEELPSDRRILGTLRRQTAPFRLSKIIICL